MQKLRSSLSQAASGVWCRMVATQVLNKHPLQAARKPGPQEEEGGEALLENAAKVWDLCVMGDLPAKGPPPLPGHLRKKKVKLTAEDERLLAERVQTWGDIDARNVLVSSNIGLVYVVARKLYRRAAAHFEDVIQEGMVGLMRATETYEPHRGIRFSTYAAFWIEAKIQRYLQKNKRQEVPAITILPMEEDAYGRRRRPRAAAVSMNILVSSPEDSLGTEFGDTIVSPAVDPEEWVIERNAKAFLRDALAEVAQQVGSERVKDIISNRILKDEPDVLHVVGKRHGVSREIIRLAEKDVVARLQENVGVWKKPHENAA